MTVDTAPQIMAVVVGKGDDFKINDGSSDGHSDGNAIMPQVRGEGLPDSLACMCGVGFC